MQKPTLTSLQAETDSVLAQVREFPGYYVDRDTDDVYSIKTGSLQKLSTRDRGTTKVVTLTKNGYRTTRRIHTLKEKARFRDLRPHKEPNVYLPNVKLSVDDVRTIRASELPQHILAVIFNVSPSTISSIVNNKSWRWVR
jgi:hypothetical protein